MFSRSQTQKTALHDEGRGLSRSRRAAAAGKNGAPPPPTFKTRRAAAAADVLPARRRPSRLLLILNRINTAEVGQFSTFDVVFKHFQRNLAGTHKHESQSVRAVLPVPDTRAPQDSLFRSQP